MNRIAILHFPLFGFGFSSSLVVVGDSDSLILNLPNLPRKSFDSSQVLPKPNTEEQQNMSKKRKTSKTGYTLFFEECKDSYVDEFRPKFLGPETLTKIREQANSQWNSMSQEKRRPYEMRAEELRSNVTKYNSLGVPILEQKKLEEDEKEKLKWMYDEIRQIVRNLFQMGPE
ncbi:hypothetical protein B566_EDAN010399, partial [Ephemera danica]